jgi:osmotically-inducible protein OsmY
MRGARRPTQPFQAPSVRHRTDTSGGATYDARVEFFWRDNMMIRTTLAAVAIASSLVMASGCAVTRDQQTAGAYIDDSVITATVKTRMLDNPDVAGTSITVETLNGTVMLSGFAKSTLERTTAERIARDVEGVKSVKNEVVVRT